jgi:two-component system invasion response regulator UvrY
MSEDKLRVMLVDDHAVVRMGFRLLVEGSGDMTVCAEGESGEEACRLYPEVLPDVLVMDVSMPGIGGLEAVTRIMARYPEARILVLSAHEDTMHPRRLMTAGARGYLSKRSAAEELIKAIRQVAQNETYLDPKLATAMVAESLSGGSNPVEVLSEREFEVFMHLARGLTVAQIAETLFLSPRTIGTHLYNIKQKLNAKNQAELTLIAMRNQLLRP